MRELASSHAAAGAVLAGVVAASAWAGEPLYTDDPWTAGKGNTEVLLAAQVTVWEDGHEVLAPTLDVACGVSERLELSFNVPLVVDDNDEDGTRTGLSHTTVGAKWHLIDQGRVHPAVSVAPAYQFKTTEASREVPKNEDGGAFLLPIEVGKAFGPVIVYGEGGRVIEQNTSDSWIYGLAGEYTPGARWGFGLEVFGSALRDFSDDEILVNAGASMRLDPKWSLLGSAGYAVRRADDDGSRALFYLALLRLL